MKVLASTLLLLVLAGCSSEDTSVEPSAVSGLSKKNGTAFPGNANNPNDYAGIIYSDLLDDYYGLDAGTLTLQQVIEHGEALAFLNPGFLGLADIAAYDPVTVAQITPYLDKGQELESLLSPSFSLAARNIFTTLGDQLTQIKLVNGTYQEAYNIIIQTEAEILAEPDISIGERSAMLTTTSILRYALHHDGKRKRRDRDWEWMTTHLAATTNAALESKPQAMMMSFATDVYQY